LAGLFLFFYSLALTLSPAVRARTWEADFRWEHWLGFVTWLAGVSLAHYQIRRHAPNHDPYLFAIVALLSGWGMLTIYRLLPGFGLRQTIWLAMGFGVFMSGLRLPKDLGFLRRYKYLWLTGGLLLTATTLIFGSNPANTGPEQWLGCCGVYLQPSEPLKLLLIAYLAAYLADRSQPPVAPKQPFALKKSASRPPLIPFSPSLLSLLAPTIVMAGIALLLLVVQRDLGTASIFLFIYASMIYLGTGNQRLALVILGGLVLVSVAGYVFFDLVRLRVDAWLNPWADPAGRSYQVVQSLIAIAAGEIFGRGPGLGSPGLVPLAHSDFIFTAIAEETGMIGVIGLLGVYALLVHRGLQIALRAPDSYRRFLAAGLTSYLAAQSLLIIGGNLRMLPLTGVTLPFLSYGGSSLMTSFICLLLLTLISSLPREAGDARLFQIDPTPTLVVNNVFLAGAGAVALIMGWWTVIRGPDLLARTDNPRQAIADRFVYRGFFLDQNGKRLVINQGEAGEYTRAYLEPSLAQVIGYSNATFGQAGLEASLDTYLRGLEGQVWSKVWFNEFLYGQHPPGSDIRLSIDRDLQQNAATRMGGEIGAVVMLNAQSGEVLAMVSTPFFDPNELDTTWETLLNDPQAPFLNRATQGAYPPGAILSPLLLAETVARNGLPVSNVPNTLANFRTELGCAFPPTNSSWGAAIQSGCPMPTAQLGERLGGASLLELFLRLGVYTPPAIRLPTSSSLPPGDLNDPAVSALGEDLRLSPLQVALAMATLSNDGIRPAPRLALAYHPPESTWMLLPPLDGQVTVFQDTTAQLTAVLLSTASMPIWESLAVIQEPDDPDIAFTWYVGGTLPDWAGTPVVVVVLLESGNVELAREIGQGLLAEIVK
jgi:cell division protein FtsW (lipid II flippase)